MSFELIRKRDGVFTPILPGWRAAAFQKDWAEDAYHPVYFHALKRIGYMGGISMEGFLRSRESFPEEAAYACRFLKRAANQT